MVSKTQEKIRVLLAVGQEVERVGLELFLSSMPGVDPAGACNTLSDTLDKLSRKAVQVVLVTSRLKDATGTTAIREIKSHFPQVHVLMLGADAEQEHLLDSLAAGAGGYFCLSTSAAHLEYAVKTVASGAVWLDAPVVAEGLHTLGERGLSLLETERTGEGTLTRREMQVLELIVEGLTNKEMSDRLEISEDTVKTHIRHLMEKLAVRDRTQAAVKALRENLIAETPPTPVTTPTNLAV